MCASRHWQLGQLTAVSPPPKFNALINIKSWKSVVCGKGVFVKPQQIFDDIREYFISILIKILHLKLNKWIGYQNAQWFNC